MVLVEAVRVPLQYRLARLLREAVRDEILEPYVRYAGCRCHLRYNALLRRVHVVLHAEVRGDPMDQHSVVGRHGRKLHLAAAPVHRQRQQLLLDLHQHIAILEIFVQRLLEELQKIYTALVGERIAQAVARHKRSHAATHTATTSATINA
uniref:Uncharacterized protein n=1 Tax=Anopheles christyi TaxID=43041 RepID=A0A182KIM1_9DIPT